MDEWQLQSFDVEGVLIDAYRAGVREETPGPTDQRKEGSAEVKEQEMLLSECRMYTQDVRGAFYILRGKGDKDKTATGGKRGFVFNRVHRRFHGGHYDWNGHTRMLDEYMEAMNRISGGDFSVLVGKRG